MRENWKLGWLSEAGMQRQHNRGRTDVLSFSQGRRTPSCIQRRRALSKQVPQHSGHRRDRKASCSFCSRTQVRFAPSNDVYVALWVTTKKKPLIGLSRSWCKRRTHRIQESWGREKKQKQKKTNRTDLMCEHESAGECKLLQASLPPNYDQENHREEKRNR